jgi:hypothetical protein
MRVIPVLAVALGGGVLLSPGAAVAAANPHYVGIVIGSRYACVRWHAGSTGADVLTESARVTYRSDGIVLTINGEPNPPHADDTHYWSYWHDTGGRWHYSSVGASGYQPKPGTVDGWSYDDGHADPPAPTADPAGLYADICGARDKSRPKPGRTHQPVAPTAHATSSSAPRTSAPASPTATRPAVTAATGTVRATGPANPARVHSIGTSRLAPAPRRRSTPAATPAQSTATQPAVRPAARSLRPLPEPKDASGPDGGSPVPVLIAVGAAVVIGGAGVWTALRRRRAG